MGPHGLGSAGVGLIARGFVQGNLGRSWGEEGGSKALKDELKGAMVELLAPSYDRNLSMKYTGLSQGASSGYEGYF